MVCEVYESLELEAETYAAKRYQRFEIIERFLSSKNSKARTFKILRTRNFLDY